MSDIKREFVFKVVLMGEGSVGKTSIRSKFMGVGFKSEYIKTIGADFASKAITLGNNKVHFQIWDLAGQTMYKHVRSSFYSGCKCGFLVFDLTSPETLEKLDNWVEESLQHSQGFLKTFIVVGNKHDLKDQLKVKQTDVDALIKKLNDMENIEAAYLVTSAKTGENIEEAFEIMGKMFLEREGFPRKGQGTDIDDVTLAKHHQEISQLTTVPVPVHQQQISQSEDEIDVESLSIPIKEIFSTIEMLNERINRLSQIAAGLEERLLLVETKNELPKELVEGLKDLQEKFENTELEISSKANLKEKHHPERPKSEIPKTPFTIPVPTEDELDTIKLDDEPDFATIDRSVMSKMTIVKDEVDAPLEFMNEEKTNFMENNSEPTTSDQSTTEQENDNEVKVKTRCPNCGNKLSYIKQYNRWYCYRCKAYI
ncbi:MAG: GTP-binding protein [Candidatus Heimdallarchaeota archaeon]